MQSRIRNSPWVQIICAFWLMVATVSLVGAEEEPLLLGVFPRFNFDETTKKYAPLADYLSERLGRKVVLVTTKDFESFWKGVTEQRYDIVQYNQYHYINSARAYQVIAVSEEFGKRAVAGALYVRKDSGITNLSQLRGRTVIFGGGKDAMLSYIAPRYLLMQAGLKDNDFKTEFAINPPNALIALHYKQADAAGGGEILIDQRIIRTTFDPEEVTLLAKTEPLLFLPWAAKRSMPPKLRAAIQSILMKLGDDGEAGQKILKATSLTGVGKAEDKDYDTHRKMITAVFGEESLVR